VATARYAIHAPSIPVDYVVIAIVLAPPIVLDVSRLDLVDQLASWLYNSARRVCIVDALVSAACGTPVGPVEAVWYGCFAAAFVWLALDPPR
jgi:hypothetical protein